MGISGQQRAFAYHTGSVSSTALDLDTFGFTAAEVATARVLHLTVSANALRYRYDGGDPTTAAGHYVPTSGSLILYGAADIAAFKMIRDGASDATVQVTLEQ